MRWPGSVRAGEPVCEALAPLHQTGAAAIISGLADYLIGPHSLNGAPSRDRLPGRATSNQVVVTPRAAGLAAARNALLLPESSMTGVVPDRGPAGPLLFPEAGLPAPFLRIKAERERQGN